jgi:DnaK suppressor protein
MKKADMKVYRDRLVDLRARLRGDVTSMTHSALRKGGSDGANGSSMPIHMAELGSENYEQEFTLSLLANEEDRLGMIEMALQRIEGGEYGQCEQCDGVIPKARLNAIPYTPVCIKCAESRDQRAPLD